jgi:electron transfer flavoprotein beta subunit
MKIIVCMKQVPDPEAHRDSFEINAGTMRVEPKGIQPVLSLFDENALEAALKIKDALSGTIITVLSIGKRVANAIFQKALSAGADELVKVEDDRLEAGSIDSFAAAKVLAAAIKKLGDGDLILCGRQSADWNAGITGFGIGESLRYPTIGFAKKIDTDGEILRVQRLIPEGYETLQTKLPAVVIAGNEAGMLRYPTMIQRREARSKPVHSLSLSDIGCDQSMPGKLIIKKLFKPELRNAKCQLIEAASLEEAGKNLARRLHADHVI